MRYILFFAGIALLALSIVSLVELQGQEPTEISIEDVLAGKFEDGDYVRVTGGWAYYAGVLEFSEQNVIDVKENCDADTRIICFYYPIFVSDNSRFKDVKLEGLDSIEYEKQAEVILCDMHDIRVIVKTDKYKKLGEIAWGSLKESKIKGSITRGVSSSNIDVRGELRKYYPGAKTKVEDMVQIEQDEIPGMGLRITGIVFGVIISVVGIIVIVQMRVNDKAAVNIASGRYALYGQPQQPYGQQPHQQYPGAQGPQQPYQSYPQNPQQGSPQRPYEPYQQGPQPPSSPQPPVGPQPPQDDGGFPKMPSEE